ncbi:MAG: glutamyl-tRNA reductase [Vulcanimicrobiaceae bacterium]
MPLVCLGLSHRTAPVEVRERHSFGPDTLSETLTALRDYQAILEAAVLSTCGRIEIYAETDDFERGVEQLKRFLTSFRHGSVAYDMDSHMYTLLGRDAVEHLFRVATGLDSMLLGEAEILGQVKTAYVQAHRANSIGPSLHQLFREALSAGKTARSQTTIGNDSVSVATAAIAMAKQHVGDLQGKTVLVIGAGKMGTTAAKRLKAEGARLLLLNRSHKRAKGIVEALGAGEAAAMPKLGEALAQADVVITSTGASHFVVDPARVTEAMRLRPDRALFIVDIAVPRDVDPEVAHVPGVALVDIDALSAVVDETVENRRRAVPSVEEIIAEHTHRFVDWYRGRTTTPVIASLTQKADDIRQAELDRLFARCPELTERERMLITGMSMTIVSRLLHSAIVRIREKSTSDHTEALVHARIVDELFDLGTALLQKK